MSQPRRSYLKEADFIPSAHLASAHDLHFIWPVSGDDCWSDDTWPWYDCFYPINAEIRDVESG